MNLPWRGKNNVETVLAKRRIVTDEHRKTNFLILQGTYCIEDYDVRLFKEIYLTSNKHGHMKRYSDVKIVCYKMV